MALALLGGAALVIRRAVVRIEGDSMAPVMCAGDLALTLPVRAATVAVGDVVVAAGPGGDEVVKRVAGLAGDWTDVMDGPLLVPADHVALRGDNPVRSTDSRHYGPVPLGALRARVVGVVGLPTSGLIAPSVRIFRRGTVQGRP